MIPTPDPFISQRFGQEKIVTRHKDIMEENNYIKIKERLTIDLTGTGVSGIASFGSIFDAPLQNSVVTFSNIIPIARESVEENNSNFASLSYSVSSSYNYYSSQYEDVISDLNEFELINIYNSTENGNPSETASNRHFSNEPINVKTFMKAQQLNFGYIPSDSAALKRFLIYPEDYDFSNANSEKSSYPFGINITSGVDNKNKKFFNLLRSSGFYQSFVKSYLNAQKQLVPLQTELVQSALSVESTSQSVAAIDMINPPMSYWTSPVNSEQQYYFRELTETNQTIMLKAMLVRNFLRKLSLDEMLTFEDVLLGKKNYTETLFYKIEKSRGDNSNTPIQTIILPATKDTIKYFDTQIKPNQVYTYRITACTLIVGSNYTYTSSPSYNPSESKCDFDVESTPMIQLVDLPILTQGTNCISDPLTPPQAIFYTKNDGTETINIRLMTNRMEQRTEIFQKVTQSDVFTEQILFSKNQFQEHIVFDNDNSHAVSYEVFKMDTPPTTIQDFSDHLIGVIEDGIYFGGITYSTRVKANQKCYYMFRSINQHGLKSNPSTIYEVELLVGSASSKIVVSDYKLPLSNPPSQSRKMRRLIQLIPSSIHTFIQDEYGLSDDGIGDPSNDGPTALDAVTLGIAQKPIWGKRFKIRVTSKNTGRKIDFNVVFDLIKKKTN